MSNQYPPPGSGQDPQEPQWNPSYPAQPPGPPGGYGQAPFGQPASNSGMAITSLSLGIVGLLLTCLCGVGALLGIGALVTGWLALRQIRASEGRTKGRGMAIAGIVLGVLSILTLIVAIILVASGAIDSEFYLETS